MCIYRKIIYNLKKRIDLLEHLLESAGIDLNNRVINVTANQPFPENWNINDNLSDLILDINNDNTATKGKIYLSTVYLDDLPSTLRQAEMKVEILLEDNYGKVLLFTITSEDVSPYHWEATSAYGRNATWRSFVSQ